MPERWKLFVAATFVIAATPGPNMLLVMTTSVRHGLRRALVTMAGLLTGLSLMLVASAAGLDALLRASPSLFAALRLLGAVYLVYLGAALWRAPSGAAPAAAPPARAGLYRQALLVSLSNPKAILFAAAFLPQFVDADKPRGPQFAALVALFAVIEVTCYLAYALGGRQAAAWLARPATRLFFDRAAGALFVGFALLLLLGS
ncbi:MAG: LysE family translocator [Elusimicrobiota bacterium]|nr:LysE family translocator [Elusimicrobiota bacterium]